MVRQELKLHELTSRIKGTLNMYLSEYYWVKAEIANLSGKPGSHHYMELTESDPYYGTIATARATIWASTWNKVSSVFQKATGSPLRAGISVLFKVAVSYSDVYGLSLNVLDIDPGMTLGEMELRRRETMARLVSEGLLDKQKDLEIPRLPYALAVISAASAAGFGDFCKHLQENPYKFAFKVDLFEADMQGASCAGSIAAALQRVAAASVGASEAGAASVDGAGVHYDMVLVLRGGGGNLDLSCYDEYELCKAVADCPIPVYSAIGHERDHHLIDDVAHKSVKTPTALADELIELYVQEDAYLESIRTSLKTAFISHIAAMENTIALLEQKIHSADPRQILNRGYILATTASGRVAKSASEFTPGDEISLLFKDGTVKAKVI